MRVLVTGARGFIGSFLVEKLITAGYKVRCLLRARGGKGWLSSLDFETVAGDISSGEGLEAAVADVDYVYHLAGCTKAFSRVDFDRANVLGTQNVLSATLSKNPHVKRFLHVSSIAAAGPSPDGGLLDEEAANRPVSNYGRSKLEGERLARGYMDRLPITVIRPPAVYGPRDTDVLAFFKQVKIGLIPLLSGGPRTASFIFVKDLADGLILAAEHAAAAGRTYYLCDDPVYDWAALGTIIAKILGVKARQITFPIFFSYLACLSGEIAGRLTRKPNIVNLDKYREIKENHWVFSNQKAKDEIGYRQKTLIEDGLRETAEWYKKQDWL